MEVSSQLNAPAALPRYILDRRKENVLPYRDSNSDSSVVQPVASHYTG
jgi:hypothetical protein